MRLAPSSSPPSVDRMKVNVVRVYVGSLMTSLEMAGVSLTLLKVKHNWEQCLGETLS